MKIKPELQTEFDEYVAKNSDPYGGGVVSFHNRWADMMEAGMGDADPAEFIKEHAQRLSHEADTEGITGFMYGCAVQALAQFWVHGEALRRWHNEDSQLGTEGDEANESGGVLNPALVSIG